MKKRKWLIAAEEIGVIVSIVFIAFTVIYSNINEGRFIPLHKMKADYEYFWDFIENGYPFTEVCERMGANLKELKSSNYKKLKGLYTEKDYYDFYDELCDEITKGNWIGHLYPIGNRDYKPCYRDDLPAMHASIALSDSFYKKLYDAFYDNVLESNPSGTADKVEYELYTKIMEEGKIAYIDIDSFSYYDDEYAKYIETINKFFKDTADYKHIIIDVSKNGGGNPDCYKYIIGLHTKKGISVNVTALYLNNKYTKPYLTSCVGEDINFTNTNIELKNTKKEFKGLKYRITCLPKYLYQYEPRKDKKFWLLISRQTASAADQFAYVCKQTGFATLVGTNTGGKGINNKNGPQALPLPKSGLLIKFEPFYGLNPDGTCHDEFGTAPDIYTAKGKDVLDTCLQEIRKDEK